MPAKRIKPSKSNQTHNLISVSLLKWRIVFFAYELTVQMIKTKSKMNQFPNIFIQSQQHNILHRFWFRN
jgi:hypothetical protein